MKEHNEEWVPPWIYTELRRENKELKDLVLTLCDKVSKLEKGAEALEKAIITEKNDRSSSVSGIGFRVGELETNLGELREKTAEDRGANDAKARQMATRAQMAGGSAIVLYVVDLVRKLVGG